MNTIISVIIPVYNAEPFLERCLISILNQDFDKEYEIIAVDDGSADNSLKILESFSKKQDKLRVISQENSGTSAARNLGLQNARGEYIAFIDSDDFVEENFLSALYNAAERSDADIAVCGYKNVNGADTLRMGCVFKHRSGVFSPEKMLKSLLFDIFTRSFSCNKLFRRSLFTENKIEYPAGMCFEDVAVMPQLFYYAKKVAVIRGNLYNYVHHKGSITGSLSEKSINDYVAAYGKIREFLENKGVFHAYRGAYRFLGVKIAFYAVPTLMACSLRDHNFNLHKSVKNALNSLL